MIDDQVDYEKNNKVVFTVEVPSPTTTKSPKPNIKKKNKQVSGYSKYEHALSRIREKVSTEEKNKS